MSEFRQVSNAKGFKVKNPMEDEDPLVVGGFNFEDSRRNEMLLNSDNGDDLKSKAKVQKTGTTIVGVVYKGGVVLGADTRATGGSTVMDKNCEKIHYMAPNIYCCGAGTAADTENVTGMISSQLELLRMNTGCESRVATAMTLLKRKLFGYQGHLSAALVLGGVDATGPHLYSIYPHGSTDKLPYVTMGSGCLAAMSVFESGYKDEMTEDEAKLLVENAIRAGIFNDLGSGSNVDITTIKKNSEGEVVVKIDRNYRVLNDGHALRNLLDRSVITDIPRGATRVLSSHFEPLMTRLQTTEATPMEL